MPSLIELRKKINITNLLERIALAYQEISRNEMQKIRERTLKNREFIENLLEVFFEVQRAYFFEKKEEKKALEKPKKERAVVFLSANARFYGALVLEIWKKVVDYLKEKKADLVVIGEIGKYLAEQAKLKTKIFYFNLDDEKPKSKEVQNIVDFLKDYEEIKVFHGKFKTILNQEVVFTDLSFPLLKESEIQKEISLYLFEPSAEEVLNFFKKELLAAFFTQVFLEHKLSRHATRMVQMYQATKKAKKEREDLKKTQRRLKWRLLDKKQQEINLLSQLYAF